MKICLLVEGSYPYVVGGVASWVQLLILGLPEHEFVIYSIGAEEKYRGKYKYALPENVTAIHEVFLDSILNLKPSVNKQFPLTEDDKECLFDLISGKGLIKFEQLLQIFRDDKKRKDPLGIFVNFGFFDVITQVYKEKYPHLPFTDFFWTIRSMMLPLFYLLQQDLPEADVYNSVAAGYCGIIGSMVATVNKKPFILTEHGIYSREREEEIIKSSWAVGEFKNVWIQYFYHLTQLAYEKASTVVTLFERNAEVEVALGCKPEKIKIIPNAVLPDRFEQIKPVVKKFDSFLVGAIVRIVPIKDIVTMIRSFALVKEALPYAKFQIIGPTDEDPEYYQECKNIVISLGMENDIEFTGVADIKYYLEDIDITVLSSISEAQPLTILESFAAKRPVVSTDVGGCRELIMGEKDDELGAAGMVVPVMDFQGIAEAIIALEKNYDLRIKMGEIGYTRVHRYYTYDKLINSYRQLYAEEHAKAGGNQ